MLMYHNISRIEPPEGGGCGAPKTFLELSVGADQRENKQPMNKIIADRYEIHDEITQLWSYTIA